MSQNKWYYILKYSEIKKALWSKYKDSSFKKFQI